MKQKEFLEYKIPILIKEGYSRSQATAVAYSMYERQQKNAQQGVYNPTPSLWSWDNFYAQPNRPYDFWQNYTPNNNQPYDFSQNYAATVNSRVASDLEVFENEQRMAQLEKDSAWVRSLPQSKPSTNIDDVINNTVNKDINQYNDQQYNDIPSNPNNTQRYNIANPYGGINLEAALNFTGNAFAEGNTGLGIAGAGFSLLSGARNFMTGYATGKENKRIKNEYLDKRFNTPANHVPLQQGGEITNADFLTGQFIVDEGVGNYNLENNEFVKRSATGNVQEVIGEPHIKNGKIADGVNVQLNNGDKVLSDYTKIPPKDIKELKERYNLSLKKGATFADAQKAYDKKLGISKVTDELSEIIEKYGTNNSVKDETARRLNEIVLSKKIEDKKSKLNSLKDPQGMLFDDLFERQERIPKKGDGSTLYDKNGKEVTETNTNLSQQGGLIEIAKKYGISPERAQELISMQQGGQAQQIHEQVAQLLQQGVSAEDILQQLLQAGLDEQQASQIIEEVAVQLQETAQQGGQLRDITDEEFQALNKQQLANNSLEFTREGADALFGGLDPTQTQPFPKLDLGKYRDVGYFDVNVDADGYYTLYNTSKNPANYDLYKEQVAAIQKLNPNAKIQRNHLTGYRQEGGGYTINTRYNPSIEGYTTTPESILNQDTLSDIEEVQPYTGEGYGSKMASVEDTIRLHGWYFDTDEKKEAFRKASKKKGEQPEVKAFQEAYNKEIEKRAKAAGLSDNEIKETLDQIGFTGNGVQKFDGKFGAFTSTRPLVNFQKTPEGEIKKDLTKPQEVASVTEETTTTEQPITENVNTTKTVMPWLPQKPFLPPSALDSVAMEQITLPRMEAIKATTEPMLAEQERQRQADVARVRELGLSPQQEAALMAQGLATTQASANDAISRLSQFNAQSQSAADQFNLNQRSKEDLTNAELRSQYQDKVFGGQNAYENNLRNFYNDMYLDNVNKYKYINDINLINAENQNYQLIPGQGLQFINTPTTNLSLPSLTQQEISNMTPEEYNNYIKLFNAKQRYGQ